MKEILKKEDFKFIEDVISSEKDKSFLFKLFEDEKVMEIILNDKRLFKNLVKGKDLIKVSSYFFFYILIKEIFKEQGINDEEIIDYVASMLSKFRKKDKLYEITENEEKKYNYLFELIKDLNKNDEVRSFFIRLHIGNYTLFLTGIFSDFILYREKKSGAPGIKFYEKIGSLNYKIASSSKIAEKKGISGTLYLLSEKFHQIRLSLNLVSDKYFFKRNKDLNYLIRNFKYKFCG
jgi:hypothetical protein